MKNQLELPRPADFHQTTLVSESLKYANNGGDIHYFHQLIPLSDAVEYRKGSINLRSVMDYFESSINFDVLDETKLEDFNKKVTEIKKNRELAIVEANNFGRNHNVQAHTFGGSVHQYDESEGIELPKKRISIRGTVILYYNGVQRMVVDDYTEFSEKYNNYLNNQALDIMQ